MLIQVLQIFKNLGIISFRFLKNNHNQINIHSSYYCISKALKNKWFSWKNWQKKMIEFWKVPWFFKISRTMVIVSKLVIWKYWKPMSKWVHTHLVTIGSLSFILKTIQAWYKPFDGGSCEFLFLCCLVLL